MKTNVSNVQTVAKRHIGLSTVIWNIISTTEAHYFVRLSAPNGGEFVERYISKPVRTYGAAFALVVIDLNESV